MGAFGSHDEVCPGCGVQDWLPCFADDSDGGSPVRLFGGASRSSRGASFDSGRSSGRASSSASRQPAPSNGRPRVTAERIEELTQQLFHLHDLNGDGFLDEAELIKLNELIVLLHQGMQANTSGVRQKYREVFREKLDASGRPVPYCTFRTYALEVLRGLDSDIRAQEMILEQFIAEAQSCRQVFAGCLGLLPETTSASGGSAGAAFLCGPEIAGPAAGAGPGPGVSALRWGGGQFPQHQRAFVPLPREYTSWGHQPHPMWVACTGFPPAQGPAAAPGPARNLVQYSAGYGARAM